MGILRMELKILGSMLVFSYPIIALYIYGLITKNKQPLQKLAKHWGDWLDREFDKETIKN